MYNYYKHLLTYLIIKRKQVFDVLSFKQKTRCNTFVILCEPRSGSTLLHTYLNSHPNIKSHGEILRERIEKGYTAETLATFLDSTLLNSWSAVIKTVGLKLFYDYKDDPVFQKIFQKIVEQKHVNVIHLTRSDSLKLFVSLKIAKKTNVWSSGKLTKLQEKITVDSDEYLKFKKHYIEKENEFDFLLREHRLLKISYEELTKTPDQILRQVQLFLGVKPRTLFTLLKKQNSDSLESIVSNYSEIKNVS